MSKQISQQKLVAFLLNHEYFAIDVHKIKEVFVPDSITPIPQSPKYVAGVINFRGQIVTTIDLKRRLLIEESTKPQRDYDEEDRNYVLIINIGKTVIGLLVDYVETVITVDSTQIQSSISLISGTEKSNFMEGVVQTDLGIVIILNLDNVLSQFDIKELEKLATVREKVSGPIDQGGDSDEVVLTDQQISDSRVDFSDDDLEDDDYIVSDQGMRKVTSDDQFGDSPLDLASLTKAELLRIAIEMGIDGVSTRSKKEELVDKIQSAMDGS